MRKYLILFLFSSFCLAFPALQNADLVFVGAENSAFSEAISKATKKGETNYTHTGIIELVGDEIFVIEANSANGVVRTAWKDFLKANEGRAIDIMRLNKALEFDASSIITRAKGFLGQGYDWYFYPNNDKMYCTELVYEAYLDKKGQRIFKAKAMNFYADDGTLPTFWEENFKKLGVKVPQGVLGTNPNDMSKSEHLHLVK